MAFPGINDYASSVFAGWDITGDLHEYGNVNTVRQDPRNGKIL